MVTYSQYSGPYLRFRGIVCDDMNPGKHRLNSNCILYLLEIKAMNQN